MKDRVDSDIIVTSKVKNHPENNTRCTKGRQFITGICDIP